MEIAKQESGNCRMLLLGLMQVVSNLILLVPFFVAAGKNGDATLQEKHASCPGDTTGMAVTNPSHSWRSLGWIVCFASCGRKSNQRKQVDERKAEGKNLKDAKVSSTFEVQAASTHQQNRNQSCGAFCLSWIAMTYYYGSNFFVESRHLVPTLVEFEKLKNFKAENDFDTYIHIYRYITTE